MSGSKFEIILLWLSGFEHKFLNIKFQRRTFQDYNFSFWPHPLKNSRLKWEFCYKLIHLIIIITRKILIWHCQFVLIEAEEKILSLFMNGPKSSWWKMLSKMYLTIFFNNIFFLEVRKTCGNYVSKWRSKIQMNYQNVMRFLCQMSDGQCHYGDRKQDVAKIN